MAKGKNDKSDKAAPTKAGKAATNGKAGATGRKDAKKAPRPAVAAERATARNGSTLPGPPPPATVGEAVVPAARTAPEDTAGDLPAAAPVAPPAAAAPAVDTSAGSSATASRRATDGSATTGARRSAAAPVTPSAPSARDATVVPAVAPERRPGLVDELTTLAMVPVDVARRVLPERRLPFYLGVGALAVVGVVEWPVVLAAGMAWEALRRRRS